MQSKAAEKHQWSKATKSLYRQSKEYLKRNLWWNRSWEWMNLKGYKIIPIFLPSFSTPTPKQGSGLLGAIWFEKSTFSIHFYVFTFDYKKKKKIILILVCILFSKIYIENCENNFSLSSGFTISYTNFQKQET